MKIIILGAGQVGSSLTESLCKDHDITVIDLDEQKLLKLQSRFDIRTIVGSGVYPDVLRSAGAETADMLVAVSSSDEANLVACQVALALFQTPKRIARVRAPQLSQEKTLFQPGYIDIHALINPAELVIDRMVRQIQHPGASMVFDFAEGLIQMASIAVEPNSILVGQNIKELSEQVQSLPAQIMAVLRDGEMILATDELEVLVHDELFFVTASPYTNQVISLLLGTIRPNRRVMIAGGGNVGMGLAKKLEKDFHVKILDRNTLQCQTASAQLQKTVILQGDASDTEILLAENIDEVDVFCSVTDDDEANLMSAIVAKRLGAKRTITIVNRQTYAHYLVERSADIDIAISPQQITWGKILTHLRKSDMVNVYAIYSGAAEAIEVVVHGDQKTSQVVGRPLRKLPLPSGTKIAAILRDDVVNMPKKDTVLLEGDRIILLVSKRKHIPDIEALFQVSPAYI